MALTDIACRTAKPREKDYKLTDAGQLYLLVRPNGSKLWRVNFAFQGKQRTLSLGAYPKVGLAAARLERDRAKIALSEGRDPSEPSATVVGPTFKKVAVDWYAVRQTGWVSSYAVRIWSRLEDDVFPYVGEKGIADIDPQEILSLLQTIEDRGAIEMAKRVRQTISNVFEFAIAKGLAKFDPAASLGAAMKRAPRVRHRAKLSEGDLSAFFKALRTYDEPQTKHAVEFVVHTFVRTNEFRYARWSEFEGDVWRIPAERMKERAEHLVPLSPHARMLLVKLKALAGKSEWVVPGLFGRKPISENTMLYCLYRLGYRSRATIHGFRGTASTILNESGLWRPDAVERQLAHVPKDEVRSAYNSALYLDERSRMMNWYSSFLLSKDTDLSDLLG